MIQDNQSVSSHPRITVDPESALADAAVQIRLDGLEPHRSVTLRAHMQGMPGHRWESSATFQADDHGVVDVATQRPLAGTYEDSDPMGLFWSMALVLGEGALPAEDPGLTRIILTAEVDDRPIVETTLERHRAAPDVRRTPVRNHGLVGTLFQPATDGPHAGIIQLGGAEGGLHEPDAALLASHGYAVLALAYFGMPPLPPTLINIPLEYFEAAINWLQSQAGVQSDRLGVIGGSRGGELALLLGATFPAITAVVSYLGSGIITEGIGDGNFLQRVCPGQPSWTHRGQPLPYLPLRITPALEAQVHAGLPVELRLVFLAGLEDDAAREAATIPVERISGPVLLLSAGDDRMWPSTRLSEFAMERLTLHHHPHPIQHIPYEPAGHGIIPPPYGPTTPLEAPGPGIVFALGGNARDNAFARADAWSRMLQFFGQHLRQD